MILHPLNRLRPARLVKALLSGAILSSLMAGGCTPKPRPASYRPPQPLPVQSFTRQWGAELGGINGPVSRLYVRENLVFAYTDRGTVFMLDRNDGRILATNTINQASRAGARLHAPVLLKDRIVFPTSTSLEIYRRDGSFVRSKNVHYSIHSDAAGSGDALFYGIDAAGGGRLVKVVIDDPALDSRWALMFPHVSVSSAPVVIGETVYAAAQNGSVVAVSTDNREPMWTTPDGTFHTYSSIEADLVADDASLFIASTDQKLICLARNNARVRWQYTAGTALIDAPAVTKDMVYQFVPGMGLVALAKDAGDYNRRPKWVAREVTQFLAQDDKYVYGRRHDNAIVAMDKNSGQPLFTSSRPDYVAFAPNFDGSIIYAATSAGRVMAVKPVLTPGGIGELVLAPLGQQAIAAAR